jgi:hypothetical protein
MRRFSNSGSSQSSSSSSSSSTPVNKRPNLGNREKKGEEGKEEKSKPTKSGLLDLPTVMLKNVGQFLNYKEVPRLRATNSSIAQPFIQQHLKCDLQCYPAKPNDPHNPEIKGECSDVCYRLAERQIRQLSYMLFERNALDSQFVWEYIKFFLVDPEQPKWFFRFEDGTVENRVPIKIKFDLNRNNGANGDEWGFTLNLTWCVFDSEYQAKATEWESSNRLSDAYFKLHPRAWPGPKENIEVSRQSRRENKRENNLSQGEKLEVAFAVRNKLNFNKITMSPEQQQFYQSSTQNLPSKLEDALLMWSSYKGMKNHWILSRVPPVLAHVVNEFTKRCPFFTHAQNNALLTKKIVDVKTTENGAEEKAYLVNVSCDFFPKISQNLAVDLIWALRKPFGNFTLIDFHPSDSKMPLARSIKNWWNINLAGYKTTRMVLGNQHHQPYDEPSDRHPYNGAPLVETKKNKTKPDENEEEEEEGKERKSENGPGLSSLSSLLAPLEGGGQAGGGGGVGNGGGGQRAHYEKNKKKTAGKKRKTTKLLFTKKKKTIKK